MQRSILCLILLAGLCLVPAVVKAEGGASRTLVSVQVFPPDVTLATTRDRQSMVVQAAYSDGVTVDVTGQSQYRAENPSLVKLQDNTLYPTADGETTLQVSYEGRVVSVPVKVEKSTVDRPISFKLDVMPVFTKSGCNMGSCHGAARGKDGFRLGLFGYDPDGDHYRITREQPARRINLGLPRESLLLTKAIGQSIHTGGELFAEDSEHYETILRWIEAGVPKDPADIAKVTGIAIYPNGAVLNGRGAEQRVVVRADYSDGTTRDVTHLAFFMTNNDTSVAISQEGVATAAERGEAFITARFAEYTVGVPMIVVPKDVEFTWPNPPANNYIDELVYAKLKNLRMEPSELCSDEVFLRRVYLDIVGKLPTTDEYDRFMNDGSTDKREKLVDELLGRKEFVEMWVMKWAELLQIRSSQQVSYKSTLLYYEWLSQRIASNMPMDQMVQELLSASGGTFDNPATNYYQNERDVLKTSENVAQVFMGMRTQCAQCHNHPFDRWTQDDYYGFAAFFSQVGRKNGEDPREQIIFNQGGGEVKHPLDNRNMAPVFLGGGPADTQGKDRREVLANWLASDENPYFAKNLANIVWAHFFGRGIIDPVDDVRITNPASNGPLLDELASKFSEYDYDFRRMVRDICTSRTYQLATQTNPTNERDETNFSHATLRRIRAEVLLDCISQVAESPNKFKGLPLGARAVQIADGQTSNYFLTTFGRASRETVCSCEVVMEPNLSQALHLLNGDTVQNALSRGKVVPELIKAGKSHDEIIDNLYVRTLTRHPTEEERASIQATLVEQENKEQVLEDLFWALLNSGEFVFNH
jgi:hypothetical protein